MIITIGGCFPQTFWIKKYLKIFPKAYQIYNLFSSDSFRLASSFFSSSRFCILRRRISEFLSMMKSSTSTRLEEKNGCTNRCIRASVVLLESCCVLALIIISSGHCMWSFDPTGNRCLSVILIVEVWHSAKSMLVTDVENDLCYCHDEKVINQMILPPT